MAEYILISSQCLVAGCKVSGIGWGDEYNEDEERKAYEQQHLENHKAGEHRG